MSIDYGLAGAEGHPRSGSVRRRLGILAGSCAVATVALLAGTSQASNAATAGSWQSYSTPISSLTGLYAPTLTNAWAVGFTQGYTTTTQYAHFTGAGWSSVSGPQIGEPSAIGGSSGSNVWVVGSTTTAHYNGSTWTTYHPYVPAGTSIDIVASDYQAQVYVAGANDVWAEIPVMIGDSAVFETLLEHFDGSAWSLASVPGVSPSTTAIGQITGSGPDDVYVEIGPVTGPTSPSQILHYNGTDWSTVPLPESADLDSAPDLSVTGPGDALATSFVNLSGYFAQESSGTWSVTDPPSSDVFADGGQTSGTGRAWVVTYPEAELFTGLDTPTLYQWSAGSWQQIPINPYPNLTGVGNGSGVWSYNQGGSVALYDAG